MFDSPLHFCPVCRVYVDLDQTREECATRQHCGGQHCPLEPFFTQVKSSLEIAKEDARHSERLPPL